MKENNKPITIDQWMNSVEDIEVKNGDKYKINGKRDDFINKLLDKNLEFECNIGNLKKVLDKASSVSNELSDQYDFLDASLASRILHYFKTKNENIKFDDIGDDIFKQFKCEIAPGDLANLLKRIREGGGTVKLTLNEILAKVKGPSDPKSILSLLTECKASKINRSDVTIGVALSKKKILPYSKDIGSNNMKNMLELLEWLLPESENDVVAVLSVLDNSSYSMDNMLSLVDKLKGYLRKEHVSTIIWLLSNESKLPSNMIQMVKRLKELNIIDKGVCQKIFAGTTKSNVTDMVKLLIELEKCGLEFGEDDCEKLLDNIETRNQTAKGLSELIKFLSTKDNILTNELLKSIIVGKLKDGQSAGDVADLLINAGNAIGWDKINFPVTDITGRIAFGQSQEDVLKLARVIVCLKRSVSTFASTLKTKIMSFNENNLSEKDRTLLNLKEGVGDYDKKRVEFIEEFKRMKSNGVNKETKKRKDDFTQNKKSGFSKSSKENKLKDNIKIGGNGIGINTNTDVVDCVPNLRSLLNKAVEQKAVEQENDNSVAGKYLVQRKGFSVEENDKEQFAQCILGQLSVRLNNVSKKYKNEDKNWDDLKETLEEEKEFWKLVNNELSCVGLFTKDARDEADKKIDDIYDLSGFLTFLQWLGCTLSVPLTFGLSLLYSPIKNRVCLHTKTSRISERLRDRKNDLTAPLRQVYEKKENQDDDLTV